MINSTKIKINHCVYKYTYMDTNKYIIIYHTYNTQKYKI